MSDAIKKAWTSGFVAKRKLKKLVSRETGPEPDLQAGETQVHYTVMTVNLAPQFNAIGLKNIKIPDPLTVTIEVDAKGEGADNLQKDATLLDLVRNLAEKEIKAFVVSFTKLLQDADPSATTLKAKSYVESTLKSQVQWFETQVAARLLTAITMDKVYLERDKKRRRKWQIKLGVKIGLSTIVVAASAAAAGATWGALSPISVVAIARSCVSIAHDVADLAMTLNQTGLLIQGQLVVLETVMTEGKGTGAKVGNSAKEVGLGAISGVLGAKSVPTINNCKGYIETYGMKITGLELQRAKTGPEVYKYMDAIDKLNQGLATLPEGSKERKKAAEFIEACEKHFENFLLNVEEIVGGILKGYENRKAWEKVLEDLPVYGWTKYASAVVGMATDLGLGVGSAGSAVEAGLAVVSSLASAANDQLMEKI